MQAIAGRRAFWFRHQRPTESGKPIGNEFEGSPNEEGLKILATPPNACNSVFNITIHTLKIQHL